MSASDEIEKEFQILIQLQSPLLSSFDKLESEKMLAFERKRGALEQEGKRA